MEITVNANKLAAVRSFQAKNDVRYYLNGICIERAPTGTDGVFIIATDGHCLASVYDATGTIDGADSAIVAVDSKLLTRLAKADNADSITLEYVTTPAHKSADGYDVAESHALSGTITGSVTIGRNRETILAPITRQDGRFPDWRRVIPTVRARPARADGETIHAHQACMVNVNYLARCAELFPTKYDGAVLHQSDNEASILCTNPDFGDRFAVVMPMRLRGELPSIPTIEWVSV